MLGLIVFTTFGISVGMQFEIDFAISREIPIVYFNAEIKYQEDMVYWASGL